jgi:hypothetical protein
MKHSVFGCLCGGVPTRQAHPAVALATLFLTLLLIDYESMRVLVSMQEGSEAWKLISEIHDTYWLVNIVDNDYVNGQGLEVFDRVMNRQAQCSESD